MSSARLWSTQTAEAGANSPVTVCPSELFPQAAEAIGAYLSGKRTSCLLVSGPHGSGKTTLLSALCEDRPAVRIPCFPGLAPGEVLSELGAFLYGLGDTRLQEALSETPSFSLHLEVAKERLCETKPVLWLDDAEFLAQGPFSPYGSVAHEAALLRELLGVCGANSCPIIVSTACPQRFKTFSERRVAIPLLEATAAGRLWRDLTGEPLRCVVARATPLSVILARAVLAREGRVVPPASGSVPSLVAELFSTLAGGARRLAFCVASAGGPPTRALLRYFCAKGICSEAALQELLNAGLLSEGEGNRLTMNPAVACVIAQAHGQVGAKELLRLLGEYWETAAARARSVWHALRACTFYSESNAADRLSEVSRGVLEASIQQGYYDIADTILSRLLAGGDLRCRAVALGNLALIMKNRGRLREALRLYGQAQEAFELLGDRANLARVYHQLGNIYYLQGELQAACEQYEKSLREAEACGDVSVATAARIQQGNVLFLQGDLARAESVYQESLRGAEKLGDEALRLAVELQLGQVQYAEGHYLEAEETLNEAQRRAELLNDTVNLSKALLFLGLVSRSRGDLERACRFFSQAEEKGIRGGDPLLSGTAAFHTGNVQFEKQNYPAALKALGRSIETFRSSQLGEARAPWALVREIAERVGRERFAQLSEQAGVAALLGPLRG